MREKIKASKRQQIRGGAGDPLLIRVLEAENPEFRSAIGNLRRNGVVLTLETAKKAPSGLIEAFDRVKNEASRGEGKEGDIPVLAAKALINHGDLDRNNAAKDTSMAADMQQVRDGVHSLTRIVGDTTAGTLALEEANRILSSDPTVRRYALHRLTWDIPEGEKNGLLKTLGIGAVADGIGFGLEFIVPKFATGIIKQGAEGLGLLVTGQSDDAVSAWSNFKTERGGGKKNKQIFKENKITLGMMAFAGLLDFAFLPLAFTHHAVFGIPAIDTSSLPSFIPHFQTPEFALHTPFDSVTNQSWYWPALTGATFAFTAYAGSLTSKLSNINRSRSTIKALDEKGLLPGREGKAHTLKPGEAAWLGLVENQSHPFRVGLLAGIGFSTAASLGASFRGVLEGNPWSSSIQAGIGPLETVTAFLAAWGAAEFGYKGYKKLKDSSELRRRLRKAPGKPLTK